MSNTLSKHSSQHKPSVNLYLILRIKYFATLYIVSIVGGGGWPWPFMSMNTCSWWWINLQWEQRKDILTCVVTFAHVIERNFVNAAQVHTRKCLSGIFHKYKCYLILSLSLLFVDCMLLTGIDTNSSKCDRQWYIFICRWLLNINII